MSTANMPTTLSSSAATVQANFDGGGLSGMSGFHVDNVQAQVLHGENHEIGLGSSAAGNMSSMPLASNFGDVHPHLPPAIPPAGWPAFENTTYDLYPNLAGTLMPVHGFDEVSHDLLPYQGMNAASSSVTNTTSAGISGMPALQQNVINHTQVPGIPVAPAPLANLNPSSYPFASTQTQSNPYNGAVNNHTPYIGSLGSETHTRQGSSESQTNSDVFQQRRLHVSDLNYQVQWFLSRDEAP
ncbi:hypothetical protein AAP_05105 [Ascosphaera apis ARSEF 7405]|uniref:Uncharacterized protein n=1 Tax=Ascosphaera apis ARSEF 7405 TaxID=392613 RepID=A0A167W165_9EURO|nr:hypothetical protein AAP_05105 [Ascosphaera apis ARSEF 7405]